MSLEQILEDLCLDNIDNKATVVRKYITDIIVDKIKISRHTSTILRLRQEEYNLTMCKIECRIHTL